MHQPIIAIPCISPRLVPLGLLLATVFATQILASAYAEPGVARSAATDLRVISWNIDHGVGKRNSQERQRVEMVHDELRLRGADVVALQEISVGIGRKNRAKVLAQRMGMHYHWQRSSGITRLFAEGLALLTTRPLGNVARQKLPFPGFPLGFAFRQVIGTTLSTAQLPHRVFLATTHFDARKGYHVLRLEQSLTLLEFITEEAIAKHRIAIITGDLNARPDEAAVRLFTGNLLNLPEGPLFADPLASLPGERVDYILVARGAARPSDIEAGVVEALAFQQPRKERHLRPSGHPGMQVDFALHKRGEASPQSQSSLVLQIKQRIRWLRKIVQQAKRDARRLHCYEPEYDPQKHQEIAYRLFKERVASESIEMLGVMPQFLACGICEMSSAGHERD